MEPFIRNTIVWVAVIVAVLVLYKFLQPSPNAVELVDSGRFSDALQAGQVREISLPREAAVEVELSEKGPDGKPARLRVATPAYRELVDELIRRKVPVRFEARRENSAQVSLMTWIPFFVLAAVWMFFFRQMQASAKKPGAQGAAT